MAATGVRRGGITAALNSRYAIWLALALPATIQTVRYWRGSVFYGEYLHWTGQLAAQLLIATMAITPLRLALPAARWVHWLMRRRRYLGVATFGYSMLHALAYLERAEKPSGAVADALSMAIGTGWVALLVLLLLAATSNDASVRRLGRRWKRLHRAIYVVAVLTFAHWILTAFDPLVGSIHLAVLCSLEAWRVWRQRQRAAGRP